MGRQDRRTHGRRRAVTRRGRLARKGFGAGDGRVEHHAQGVQIAADRRSAAFEQFRGHVRRGPGDGRARLVLRRQGGDAEVGNPHLAAAVDHDVGRLQIAVQHPLVVCRTEAGAQLLGDLERLVAGHAADAAQQRSEVFAVHVLHGDKDLALRLHDVVNPQHVGMRDLAGQADLVPIAAEPGRVCRAASGEEFQSDWLLQLQVVCPIDVAHAAASQRSEQTIAAGQDGARRKAFDVARGVFGGGRNEGRGYVVPQQRLHLVPQFRIAGACLIQQRGGRPGLHVAGSQEDSLDLLVTLGSHAVSLLLSSRRSQAHTMVHSRSAERLEIPRTRAVSSTLRPPKNRNSTICACCGSNWASRTRASSRASRSASGWKPGMSLSLSVTRFHPPPRLAAPRCRAIQENAPHGLGRHGEEMRLPLPIHALLIDQLEVGLVHQRGGLDGVPRRFAAKELFGQAPQSLIDGIKQPIHRRAITGLQVVQESRDFGRCLHAHRR